MPTLNRIGKEKVVNHHYKVPYKVLDKQYSFGDKNTGNKIIHGDNLEALKSLLPEYEGKIKCIYIDPPYNTGNEGWVYNDNVTHPKIQKWLGDVVGKEGEDLTRHDKWLCMMYPRLKLLHKLLADDGVIFISIDDNEQAQLKLMMDEIFGGRNFINNIILQKSSNGIVNKNNLAIQHEYLVIYGKKCTKLRGEKPSDQYLSKFNKEDKYGKYKMDGILMKKGADSRREDSPNLFYPLYGNLKTGEVSLIQNKDFKKILPIKSNGLEGRRTRGKDKVSRDGYRLYSSPKGTIYIKDYIKDRTKVPVKSIFSDVKYINNRATNEVKELFTTKIFDTPKPISYVKKLIEISTKSNSIVLDSFAGSGTTAHAVLNLNKEDGGNRKFILIEMEDYADTITAERVKRVTKGYGEGIKKVEGTGGGFDYYKLGQPLFIDNDNLNEEVGEQKIREYIWYTETKQPLEENTSNNKYRLGVYHDTNYYFHYEKENVTNLDYDFLSTVEGNKGEQFIIYADVCLLDDKFMTKNNIIFKKIPRDISKF